MSEIRDITLACVKERMVWTSENCQNAVTGDSFIAEVEPIADLELNTAMGRDPRESITLHILDPVIAASSAPGMRININLYGKISLFELTRKTDNPASPLAEFGARKVVPGLDQS